MWRTNKFGTQPGTLQPLFPERGARGSQRRLRDQAGNRCLHQLAAGLAGCLLYGGALICIGCSPAPNAGSLSVQPPELAAAAERRDFLGTASAAEQWREQFSAVASGRSERILIDAGPVTADQLAELSQLTGQLTELLIDAGGVSDDMLPSIAAVESLVHLRLRESPISDAGLATLVAAGLPELRILNIPQGDITARGIAALASLPRLSQLRLGGPQIDDAAVAAVAQLPELRSLHLIGPRLTDVALETLAGSPRLSTFYLDDCSLSDKAWEELFAAKPSLHVHVDQLHHDRDPHAH